MVGVARVRSAGGAQGGPRGRQRAEGCAAAGALGGAAHPEVSRGQLPFMFHAHLEVVELPETFALEEVGFACKGNK